MRLSIIGLSLGLIALAQNGAALAQPVQPGARTTDGSVSTSNTTVQCLRSASASPPSVGTPNEFCGFYSLQVPDGHGGAKRPYEALAIYARAVTDDPNTAGLDAYDTGPFDGHVSFGPHCTLAAGGCRGFGPHGLCVVPTATDGLMSCIEGEIENNGGADQPEINKVNSKIAFHSDCIGTQNCTAAYGATATGGKFHMILEATTAEVTRTDCFTCLLSGDRVSSMFAGTYGDGHSLATGSSDIIGPSRTTRLSKYMTGSTGGAAFTRWGAGADQNAEMGANTGSDYVIARYDDDGRPIDAPVSIARSTGVTTFAHAVMFSSIARPAQATFANLGRLDPDPAVGDYLVISDASTCSANNAVTAGGRTGHACAVIYNGAANPWIALVSH